MGGIRRAWCSAVVLAVALVASCTDDRPSEPSTQTKTPRIDFAPEPLWRGSDRRLLHAGEQVRSARFIGSSLLIEAAPNTGMVVIDPATGKPRWSMAKVRDRAGHEINVFPGAASSSVPVTGDSANWSILLQYNAGSGEALESGFASVEGDTGRVRWATRLNKTVAGKASELDELLVGADNNVAVSWFTASDSSDGKPMTASVLATDVADGSTLWQAKGMWPQFVAAGRVLGVTASKPPELSQEGVDAYVTALDARTGKERWNLKSRYRNSRLYAVAGDVALVGAETNDDEVAVVIDAESGRELANLGKVNACDTDEQRLIACVARYGGANTSRVVTFDVDKQEKQVSPALPDRRTTGEISGVWGDYIFLGDSGSGFRALDRNGNIAADNLPGRFIAMSERYALFSDLQGQASTEFALYRVQE